MTIDPIQVRYIFDEASELPLAQRLEFVHTASKGDEALKREVLSLLDALDQASTVDSNAAELNGDSFAQSEPPALLSAAGDRIGGFRLVRRLGHGSMGTVYEAEQDMPSRRIAIKVLHVWITNKDARRRLVSEAAFLARLDHPGIARVIAAGTQDVRLVEPGAAMHSFFGESTTVPWLAMELVDGARTLPEYARHRGLDWRQRVELFARVCDAVHYGHSQGVIHRDLKPANVLVNDGGDPKVIDFGVARAVGSSGEGTLQATLTHELSVIGTLRYMSPEQCDGRSSRADTRSDVYALGLMLYELLVERPPYPLSEESFASSARTIIEQEPTRPRSIMPDIERDLETVILKAIEKNPGVRYQSAREFADDLRRVLSHEPVRARTPTPLYSTTKWVRRHPARAMLAAAAIIGIIVGVLGITIGLVRERAARRVADHQSRIANIVAADFAIRQGDGATAMARLDGVPPSLRGWEWAFLRGRSDTSIERHSFADIAGSAGAVDVTPDPGLVLVLSDRAASAVDTGSRRTLWTVEMVPSNSSTRFSVSGGKALILGVHESLVVAMSDGWVLQRFRHAMDGMALGGALDPSGRLVVLTGPKVVTVYEIATSKLVQTFASEGAVYGAAFDPTGSFLAWSDAREVVIAETSNWSIRRRISTSRPTIWEPSCLAWSPDGRWIASTADKEIELHSAKELMPTRRLTGARQRIESIVFSQDSSLVLAGSRDTTVRVWNAERAALVDTLIGHNAPVRTIVPLAQAEGHKDILTADSNGTTRRWCLGVPAPIREYSPAGRGGRFISAIGLRRDGSSLVAGAFEGGIERWHVEDGVCTDLTPCGEPLSSVSIAKSVQVALTISTTGVVRSVTLDPVGIKWSRTPSTRPRICALAPDGTIGVVADESGSIWLISMHDGSTISLLSESGSVAERLGFNSTGNRLAVARNDGSLEIWDVPSRRRLRVQHPPTSVFISPFAFSPDGRLIAYATPAGQGSVCLADVQSGVPLHTMAGLRTTVWSLAFSPDGSRLAIGGQDRKVRIIDANFGEELLSLCDHQGSVMCIEWAENGRCIATGGFDRRVFMYSSPEVLGGHPAP
jgi:serine/threonine protein kinase/WD40 repeat protein